MVGLLKRDPKPMDVVEPFPFDRFFDDWVRTPLRWPRLFGWDTKADGMIHVDEFMDDTTLVIRAEMPGIDPDTDVELTVVDGMLRIAAERRFEEKTEEQGYLRHELRTGTFVRMLPMPEGATEADVKAVYADGILEVRIPTPTVEVEPPVTRIPITRS